MNTNTLVAWTVTLMLSASPVALAAKSTPVNIMDGNQALKGTLFTPDSAAGALPLVLVVHEWWGKTEYPDMRAKRIADELGYAALAVDLFGDGKTAKDPGEAQALTAPFYKDGNLGAARLQAFAKAAPEAAKSAGTAIDMSRIAAIGYCYGGTQALNLARAGGLSGTGKLLGVVSFHGGLGTSMHDITPILPKLLVLNGGADKMVDEKQVKEFKEEMKKAKADLTFHSYPGALHAFTNPKATEMGKKFQMPIAYNEKADKDSWQRMKAFLAGLFGK